MNKDIDKRKKTSFATSEHPDTVIEMLRECRTPITQVADEDSEYRTVRNAHILDAETGIIKRFIDQVQQVKQENRYVK